MAEPSREALSAVDAAWLRMDRPTNRMVVCGVMQLDGRIALADLQAVVRDRLLRFHRLRQRVVDADSNPYWENDPWFDLDWHVRPAPPPAHAPLQRTVGELIGAALDPERPMWQLHLLDLPGGSAIVVRIHHCYGDGFALLHVVDTLTDLDPHHPRAPPQDVAAPVPPRAAWERMLGPVTEMAGDAVRSSLSLAAGGAQLALHPLRAADYALSGVDLLYQAGLIAAMAPDAHTRLKGQLGVAKRVAWAPPLPLADVKAVAAGFGCSVNDVLVACVAGALRAWLQDQGDAPPGADIRALVPVNLRPPGPIEALGNRFGLVFLELPAGLDDPLARLREVHRRMEALKHSQQPLVALGILNAMGVAPRALRERLLEVLAANASLVLTNVHGQDTPRYLAGRRIAQQMFWVPQSGGIGVGASIFSYAGKVYFGLLTDALRVPDPAALAQRFAEEFEALVLAALLAPWPATDAASRPH
ncbi:MAG: wax ester/triacylglycerol synthase family O-acyltransferase [Telluria sp.]